MFAAKQQTKEYHRLWHQRTKNDPKRQEQRKRAKLKWSNKHKQRENAKRRVRWRKQMEELKRNPEAYKTYKLHQDDLRHKRWDAILRQSKINRDKLRLLVLTHYSNGQPKCSCCGETNLEFLSIDHINGRKTIGHARSMVGTNLYRVLRRENYPEGFRVLCYNCNFSHGHYHYCPHQRIMEVTI